MSKTVLSNTNLLFTCAWYRQLISKTTDISAFLKTNPLSSDSERCLICKVKFCSYSKAKKV